MILPIHIYGSPVLREPALEVTENSEALQQLIDDMFETMYGAAGIGLAAPQIGRTERLFVCDVSQVSSPEEPLPEEPLVFINPVIEPVGEYDCEFEEGCLSIPDLREMVVRPEEVQVNYLDRNFEEQELHAEGLLARVIQHEYDHLEGILFVDHISSFKRRLMGRKLKEMTRGNVEADYPLFTDF